MIGLKLANNTIESWPLLRPDDESHRMIVVASMEQICRENHLNLAIVVRQVLFNWIFEDCDYSAPAC
jgi:hypothetical protein